MSVEISELCCDHPLLRESDREKESQREREREREREKTPKQVVFLEC